MEEQLRTYLLTLAAEMESSGGISAATIGKRAINDTSVFTRLRDRAGSFNVRTFDRLVQWISDNWPAESAWPENVPRPDAPLIPNEVRPEAVQAEESTL